MKSADFQTIANTVNAGMLLLNSRGEILSQNRSAQRLFEANFQQPITHFSELLTDASQVSSVLGSLRTATMQPLPRDLFIEPLKSFLTSGSSIKNNDSAEETLYVIKFLDDNPYSERFRLLTDQLRQHRKLYHRLEQYEQQKSAELGKLKSALETENDAIWHYSVEDRTVRLSPHFLLQYGIDELAEWISLTQWMMCIHPEDRQKLAEALEQHILDHTRRFSCEYRALSADGEYRWLLSRGTIVETDADGKPELITGIVSDVTHVRNTYSMLEQTEANLQALLNSMADGVFVAQNHRFVFANQAMTNIIGMEFYEFIDSPFEQVISAEFLPIWNERYVKRIGGDKTIPSRYELKMRRADIVGEIWVELIASSVTFQSEKAVMGIVRDISDRKAAEALIWNQANYDFLTKLPNRKLLEDNLKALLSTARSSGNRLAIMLLDLDDFKGVNDTEGHAFGDKLLCTVADRLVEAVPDSECIARFGGDEFVIVLSLDSDLAQIEQAAQNVLSYLSKPIQIELNTHYVSASLGITVFPRDARSIYHLLRNADLAMYAAKSAGRNCYRHFCPEMQVINDKRMELIRDMQHALVGEEFYLVYQPIVSLKTGALIKAEALLRWQHPAKGQMSPASFIPTAEESGLILPIGEWVFEEALRMAAKWRYLSHKSFQIGVNISPKQLSNNDTRYRDFIEVIKSQEYEGNMLCVEITEGMLLEPNDKAIARLKGFRELGVKVALDDFGTGYSSLSYLKKFDIDLLKIDRSFVKNLSEGSDELVLCQAIITMAHTLNIEVIAEGIETEEQMQLLKDAGCDYGQGYFISYPLSAEEMEQRILNENRLEATLDPS
ncbi:PAS/PAC and GAF sensor-containing diguanylate cyclase/phosphodiesterase [Methylophaga lonarensis MPL]|uniref:PAS/PAC and GAF sensor-containing diguanylate cyclase/phosphodiesterase n=2 Tax=Methylophaga lonarensis TaxID=999151 RepID=M7PQX3_9GAMM|nr:GGDEF and EAL domain-containing protein [Methylophaga lonarensis]EMR12824.1 PAS/PAC and GAF sensor-containing diguanylate cyclase/phosphodiesterase [Methylophaga lonarensis MPL]